MGGVTNEVCSYSRSSFETEIEVDAENCKKAKIVAAEKFLYKFPKPSSFRIETVSVPVKKKC